MNQLRSDFTTLPQRYHEVGAPLALKRTTTGQVAKGVYCAVLLGLRFGQPCQPPRQFRSDFGPGHGCRTTNAKIGMMCVRPLLKSAKRVTFPLVVTFSSVPLTALFQGRCLPAGRIHAVASEIDSWIVFGTSLGGAIRLPQTTYGRTPYPASL
jgi:hypothetical protein